MRSSLAAAFVFFCALSATAGTITSISPATVKVNSGETFLTINGSSLGDLVIFDGPAGHFEIVANAVFTSSTITWVPEAIIARSGIYTVKCRNRGVDSNSVNFEVRGFKVFPLVILVPEFIFQQALTREGAYVKFDDPIVMGGDDPNPAWSCDQKSGAFFKMGVTRVNCTATNIDRERADASFDINVFDREAPIVKVPDSMQVKATSREGAVVEFQPSAFDDIYGEVVPECLPRSGSVFPIGTTNVTCTATDFDDNIGFGVFTVEVLGEVKWYPLTVIVPEEGILVEAEDPGGTTVKYDVKVTGTDDPSPEVTCDPPSGTTFPIGQTSVLCTAIDRWGMRGSAGFNVDVVDPAPPEIFRLAASPSSIPYDKRLYPIKIDVSAADKIDLNPYCAVFDVTSIENIHLGDGDDPKSYDWRITGQFSLELRGDRDGLASRVYDIWVSCTDFYGNDSRASVQVTVPGDRSSVVIGPSKRRAAGRK